MQVSKRNKQDDREIVENRQPPTKDVLQFSVDRDCGTDPRGTSVVASDHQGMVVAAWAGRQEHIGSAFTAELQALEEAISLATALATRCHLN
jgi:hypothetical protein